MRAWTRRLELRCMNLGWEIIELVRTDRTNAPLMVGALHRRVRQVASRFAPSRAPGETAMEKVHVLRYDAGPKT